MSQPDESQSKPRLVHATAVALGGLAVLLRGPSGSGKSDLALRLLGDGWQLVADDQTQIHRHGEILLASAPTSIAGKMEVRGLGIVGVEPAEPTPIALLIDLKPLVEIERLPEPEWEELEGITLARLAIDPFTLSAPAKLRLALGQLGIGNGRGHQARTLLLVTGMSGGGRSVALAALEDLGYEAINNLPLSLLEKLLSETAGTRPLAVGIDIRTRDFAAGSLNERLDAWLGDARLKPKLIFIECDDQTLLRRFTETRRRHPLAEERPVIDGIALERRLLGPIKARADHLIDTSQLAPGDLKRLLAGNFTLSGGMGMTTFVTSFSYRQGLPREADLVIDARFLRNPHYIASLRPQSGMDLEVERYVTEDADFARFFQNLTQWLAPLLPRYEREGKSYLTLAVGCTGGRHRSVVVAERLVKWLRAQGRTVALAHRDLGSTPKIG